MLNPSQIITLGGTDVGLSYLLSNNLARVVCVKMLTWITWWRWCLPVPGTVPHSRFTICKQNFRISLLHSWTEITLFNPICYFFSEYTLQLTSVYHLPSSFPKKCSVQCQQWLSYAFFPPVLFNPFSAAFNTVDNSFLLETLSPWIATCCSATCYRTSLQTLLPLPGHSTLKFQRIHHKVYTPLTL